MPLGGRAECGLAGKVAHGAAGSGPMSGEAVTPAERRPSDRTALPPPVPPRGPPPDPKGISSGECCCAKGPACCGQACCEPAVLFTRCRATAQSRTTGHSDPLCCRKWHLKATHDHGLRTRYLTRGGPDAPRVDRREGMCDARTVPGSVGESPAELRRWRFLPGSPSSSPAASVGSATLPSAPSAEHVWLVEWHTVWQAAEAQPAPLRLAALPWPTPAVSSGAGRYRGVAIHRSPGAEYAIGLRSACNGKWAEGGGGRARPKGAACRSFASVRLAASTRPDGAPSTPGPPPAPPLLSHCLQGKLVWAVQPGAFTSTLSRSTAVVPVVVLPLLSLLPPHAAALVEAVLLWPAVLPTSTVMAAMAPKSADSDRS